MNTPLIVAAVQASEPAVIEIIEAVDSTTPHRSRRALIRASPLHRQSLHLKPDEYTIAPLKNSEE